MLAIAGKMMLKRRKIPSTLYLGITRDVEKENSLKAYAWLRSGIHILTGNKGLSEPLNNSSVTKIEQNYCFSGMVPCAVIYARYLWNVQNDLNLRKILPNVSGDIPS